MAGAACARQRRVFHRSLVSRRVGTHQLIAPASSGSRARFAYPQQSKVIGAEFHKWSLVSSLRATCFPGALLTAYPAWPGLFIFSTTQSPTSLTSSPIYPSSPTLQYCTCGLKPATLLYVTTRGMPVCVNARFHTLHAHASLVFSLVHPSCLNIPTHPSCLHICFSIEV